MVYIGHDHELVCNNGTVLLPPSRILFTQAMISREFKPLGYGIRLYEALRDRFLRVARAGDPARELVEIACSFPAILVRKVRVADDAAGRYAYESLDNRRLWLFRRLEELCAWAGDFVLIAERRGREPAQFEADRARYRRLAACLSTVFLGSGRWEDQRAVENAKLAYNAYVEEERVREQAQRRYRQEVLAMDRERRRARREEEERLERRRRARREAAALLCLCLLALWAAAVFLWR
eukprot:tig00020801_g13980.t1